MKWSCELENVLKFNFCSKSGCNLLADSLIENLCLKRRIKGARTYLVPYLVEKKFELSKPSKYYCTAVVTYQISHLQWKIAQK